MTTINTNTNINVNAQSGVKSGDTEYLSAGKNISLMGTAMVTMDSIMLLFTELANSKFEQMSKKTEVSRDAQDMANRVDALLASLADANDTAALPPEIIAYMRANNIEVNGQSIDKFLGTQPQYLENLAARVDAKAENAAEIDRLEKLIAQLEYNSVHAPNEGIVGELSQAHKDLAAAKVYATSSALNEEIIPELNKAELTAVKSALESHSGRASDFVQQNQLKLQQLMQNFNTAVTMANSVQSMNAESTKSIAQSIR